MNDVTKELTLNDYQIEALKTAVYPNIGNNITYPTLGLCGEAGELANKVKKILRDDGGKLTQEKREALADEAGDVMWYIAALASELAIPLDEIARRNLAKLATRREHGTIHGSGDQR